jgi:transcriptional regulator NrdR family protein
MLGSRMNKPTQLRNSLEGWLHRNNLQSDCTIYTSAEWSKQNESYCKEAELVIVSEGGLCVLLNYSPDESLITELDDLLESFGYYYELGCHWYLGLYPTGVDVECPVGTSYTQKLKDERWKIKRQRVLNRTRGVCQDCLKSFDTLEVHHCYYMTCCHPWQYPLDSLRALCRGCHEKRAVSEMRLNALLARVDRNAVDRIYNKLLYSLERSEIATKRQ